jgi:hypothetical protein
LIVVLLDGRRFEQLTSIKGRTPMTRHLKYVFIKFSFALVMKEHP